MVGAWLFGVEMGVEGTPVVVGALELIRAVRGVGAPIKDFRGVSVVDVVEALEIRLLTDVDEDNKLRAVEAVDARTGLGFRPADRKG